MSEGDNTSVYIYNGVGEVPEDVTHVRVDPSVTVIPVNAFQEHQHLVEVELPEGLIRIKNCAFFDCRSLKRINIPSTVKKIGESAFENCPKLDDITLPEGLRQLGLYAFYHCESLKRIKIPPGIEVLEEGVFCNCWGLIHAEITEGIREMERDPFSRCKALASVTLPSSLKNIGIEAFEGCNRLNEIHIPDAIESIHARAFKYCNFTNFRMPLQLGNDVDISLVEGNSSLVSLELPESVEQINDKNNTNEKCYTDLSVRNIALPSNCEAGTGAALRNCKELEIAFPDANYDDNKDTTISDALKQRFDNLPIHKICYYQSYHDNETTIQNIKREINPWTSNPPGQLNSTGIQQDCLGMTPLHILACSTKPTIEMYQLLIEKYPETLTTKDKWGDIPLLYAIWCNSPSEVVDLLVESYKSLHPEYEFNWSGMIRTLVKRHVPLANVQALINTQQDRFPEQECNMQGLVMEFAAFDTVQARFNKPCTAVDTVQYLIRASITKRLDFLDIAKWRIDLENSINALPDDVAGRERHAQSVYDKLAIYESIKEGTSVLELALWKAKIDISRSKRAKVSGEDISYKEQCRINCGADIIIRNVLPYLLPNEITIDSRNESDNESDDISTDDNESDDESSDINDSSSDIEEDDIGL